MNYGKENLDKRKKNISSKKNMKKKRVGVRFFKALVICVLLIAVIGAGGVGLFVKKIIDDAPKVTPNLSLIHIYTGTDSTQGNRFVAHNKLSFHTHNMYSFTFVSLRIRMIS